MIKFLVHEQHRDRMQSERVAAPLLGSPAGKLPHVPQDVRKVQKQAEKEKKKTFNIAANAATKGTKDRKSVV